MAQSIISSRKLTPSCTQLTLEAAPCTNGPLRFMSPVDLSPFHHATPSLNPNPPFHHRWLPSFTSVPSLYYPPSRSPYDSPWLQPYVIVRDSGRPVYISPARRRSDGPIGDSGMRDPGSGKPNLRRGLWSPEEDEKLYGHITRHGVGCWSAVPKLAGLQRCGKSCRLRWINYLRPDLKRGCFTPEEEDLIVRLHKILGNRWAKIAAQLPGRTDNEIKNFWNSCLKKKLRRQGIDPSTHEPLNAIADGTTATDIDARDLFDKQPATDQPPPAHGTEDTNTFFLGCHPQYYSNAVGFRDAAFGTSADDDFAYGFSMSSSSSSSINRNDSSTLCWNSGAAVDVLLSEPLSLMSFDIYLGAFEGDINLSFL